MIKPQGKVLIVGGAQADRELYRRWLQDAPHTDYEIREEALGERGLAACRGVTPDCILLEDRLPDLTGVQFLERLHAQLARQRPAVVMLTTRGSERTAAEALQHGAQDYLTKGTTTSEQLGRAVRNAIEKRTLQRTLEAQQQALGESEERFRAIADYTYDWESWIGPDGRPLWVNPAVERLTGWSVAECLAMPEYPLPLIHEADRPHMAEHFRAALAGESANDVEFRIQHKAGHTVWAAASWQAILTRGARHGYRSSVREITARKLAEARQSLLIALSDVLADSLEVQTLLARLTALMVEKLADYCIVTVTEEDQVRWLEAAAADPAKLPLLRAVQQYATNLGSDAPPLPRVLRTQQPLLAPEVTDAVLQAAAQTPEHGQLLRGLEPRSLLIVPLLVHGRTLGALGLYSCTPSCYGTEDLVFAQEVARRAALAIENARLYQLTQLLHADAVRHGQELQRINAEFRQFSYIVAHDLSEPLRTMHSYIQLVAQRLQGTLDTETAGDMAFVTEAARRMQQMLTDLLAYTRVGQTPTFTAVDGEVVLAQVLGALQARIGECSAVITHDPLPTVQGDATRLRQVLQNLIGNALKFCEATPPRIHIAAVKEEQHWRVSVRDNGIGIDPRHTGKLFQVFQRLHPRGHYPGTGMGLAICKKIIEQHGGRIWVESQPGQGATFFFTLPA